MNEAHTQDKGFETVFRHSKDGLAIFKDGIFVDCNQSMLDLVGLATREEFIGLTPFDFSPEYQFDGRSSAEKGMEYITQCYEEGSVRFEWLHKKSNGEPFWCEVIITKMTLAGEVVVHANWRDITEKKDLELKLAEQKEIFETLFNESMDGLSVFDGQKYVDCNKAFLRMFGFSSKDEVIGIHPKDISPEFQADGRSSKEAAKELIFKSLDKGSTRFKWIHCKKDRTNFWTEVIITKVNLKGVDVIYAVIRDISEKKALELELYERNTELDLSNSHLELMIDDLKRTQEQLVESEKMASLGSLVAGVAHEINTPVGVGLMGITQFMEETKAIRSHYHKGELTENSFEDYLNSANELSNIVHKNLERTAQLVRGFKQIAVDQTSEEERSINLREYLEEVVFSLGSMTRKANTQITIDCPDNFNVVTNPGLISQVVTNLIVNSMVHGFSERGFGEITIQVREEERNYFVMTYQDNGKGISKEILPRIFDPFFTTNRANGGTGLGLNVTYNIVKNALGGSIECQSEPNQGVQFTIGFGVKDRA
ncbi:PAS domain-containing sensor histidine kinase [Vibrio porteresiae]|uniref:histidine kinase n=1 Tax=Vibrio porteresiae DSM 19223 TaxID=1123496 RepID=A0ABZ0Q877_9VIBR|nr:PAS domain-containing sensor histidine kinase [Vibrio porteresiae]WPC72377.1 PAS domain-containing sensor histidine kinase [Vibrio porteresiae DSM 19223]